MTKQEGRLIRSKETANNGSLIQRTQHLYDNANRLTEQSWQIGNNNYSEKYVYDDTDGKLSSITTAANATITLTYDALKRLSSETTSVGSGTLYAKNYEYRDSTSTTGRTTLQVGELSYDFNGSSLAYRYSYNTVGDISTIKNASNTTIASYTYDQRQQLTSATLTSGDALSPSITYTYPLYHRM